MRRGCFLGCLGVIALIIGAAIFLEYRMGVSDMFSPSPRHDTFAAVDEPPAVWLRINPNSSQLIELIRYGMQDNSGFFTGLASSTLPHEATLAFAPDPDGDVVRVVLAMSMQRFGRLLERRASASLWRWWAPQRIDSMGLEDDGLWVVRSHLPLGALATEAYGASFGSAETPEPLRAEGGHLMEAIIDNRAGGAFLSFVPLLLPPAQLGDLEETPRVPLDHEQLADAFSRLTRARITANFVTDDVVNLHFEIECPDAAAAEACLLGLFVLQDEAYDALLDLGVEPVGDFKREDNRIRADIAIVGVRRPLAQALRGEGIF